MTCFTGDGKEWALFVSALIAVYNKPKVTFLVRWTTIDNFRAVIQFLVADTRLHLGLLVGPSVGRWVGPSVGHIFEF